MFDLIRKALLAKVEAANAERDRIRQDIHDDLGAKLLSIQLSSKDKEPAKLAKEALNDLRNLLHSIEIEPIALSEALLHWQQEAQARLPDTVLMTWEVPNKNIEVELPPEHFSHITRAIRECLTNALRHAEPTTIHCTLNLSNGLDITIYNNGVGKKEPDVDEHVQDQGGRGSSILHNRCQRLGGSFKGWQEGDHWFASISIPLTL